METKQRLAGIDLFRGIAAYAVTVIHASDRSVYTGYWAEKLAHFSGFAVPFFLATSFYFLTNRSYLGKAQYSLKAKFSRLLIPYLFWSVVYLFSRILKFLSLNKPNDINELFQDPIALLFCGGAAVHLYFIPILFSGLFIYITILHHLVKEQVTIKILILLFVLSMIVWQSAITSGNSFQMNSSTAFEDLLFLRPDEKNNQLIRLVLVELAWIIGCLPYIFIAMILNHPSVKSRFLKFNFSSTMMFFCTFFLLNIFTTFGKVFFNTSVSVIAIAYSSLLFAISLSTHLNESRIITNLGLCSFGIYLMHHLVIEIFHVIASKVYPASIVQTSVVSVLTFSILSFLVSWLITSTFIKKRWASKSIFGV